MPFGIQAFQVHLNYYNQKDFENLKGFIEKNSKKIIDYDKAISKVNNNLGYKLIRFISKKILKIKRLV